VTIFEPALAAQAVAASVGTELAGDSGHFPGNTIARAAGDRRCPGVALRAAVLGLPKSY